jgi:hypothetical protein
MERLVIILFDISAGRIDQSCVEKGFGLLTRASGHRKHFLILPQGIVIIPLGKKPMTSKKIDTDLDLLLNPLDGSAAKKKETYQAGNTKINVLPGPGLRSAHIFPPWCVTICLAMANPKPVPFG